MGHFAHSDFETLGVLSGTLTGAEGLLISVDRSRNKKVAITIFSMIRSETLRVMGFRGCGIYNFCLACGIRGTLADHGQQMQGNDIHPMQWSLTAGWILEKEVLKEIPNGTGSGGKIWGTEPDGLAGQKLRERYP